MVQAGAKLSPEPVFLYYDPHPVHEKMASHIGAEMVQCETGSPAARFWAGRQHDFGNRPVILEGGVPLAEGAVLQVLGSSGPVIALGADSTYHDIVDPMQSRSRASRYTHRFAQRFVDGTLAVSERIATIADQLTDGPVRVTHPFVGADRFERLRSLEPTLAGSRVLCVGKYREKNGQDVLVEAIQAVDTNITVDFVGPDTKAIESGEQVRTHGFVSEDRLIELFESAALMVFSAPVGAFPVATLEGLCAGLPVLTTHGVGTATLIRAVDGHLISDATPAAMAHALDWYFSLSSDEREALSRQAANYGSGFNESSGLEAFKFEFENILDDIGYDWSTTNV